MLANFNKVLKIIGEILLTGSGLSLDSFLSLDRSLLSSF